MIEKTVEQMYEPTERNRFLEVTYASGDKGICTSRTSRALMVENIVRRAKKEAIKRFLSWGEGHPLRGPRARDPRRVRGERGPAEHHEPRRLGLGTSGKKGERIVYVRTLLGDDGDGRQVERVNAGQYLQGWPRGHPQGLRDRNRVRISGDRRPGLQSGPVLFDPDLHLCRISPQDPLGLRTRVAAARCSGVRTRAGTRGHGGGPRSREHRSCRTARGTTWTTPTPSTRPPSASPARW